MAIPWTAIAQVASSAIPVIGKLFGGDDKSSGRIDLKALVRDAERAGFNPLTVLRNGGAAGYQQTHHPALSTATVIGEALGNVGVTLANYDPHADEKRQAERLLFDAQLENIQADTGLKMRSLNIPTKAGDQTVRKIPDLYSPWIDNSAGGAGKTVWLPNADLPDIEQMPVPALGSVGSASAASSPVEFSPVGTPLDRSVTLGSIYDWWNRLAEADYRRQSSQ